MPKNAVIPDLLKTKDIVFSKYFTDISHPLMPAVQRLILSSDFAGRHIELIKDLFEEKDALHALNFTDYQHLIKLIPLEATQVNFAKKLRLFRHKHYLRIYLRELAGLSQTEETYLAWSDCADALIIHCLDYCQEQLQKTYGLPRDGAGHLSHLLALAMGKLGGRELNFSSDIDLIFAFSENGETEGGLKISNQQYFTKVVQLFVNLMQQASVDGFVFRVDLRLRPNGDSGPLVSSLAAMETYYQEQGRDWERYAMVKARLINPVNAKIKKTFTQLIEPFVYRRYVDFSVIESLRSMKSMIEREIKLDPRLDDIKRGQGGIREVEFIIQSLQLIRGGRMPQLRQQNAMKALACLKQEKLIDRADALKQAYLFLRQLENALQALNDQQTHSMPQDALRKIQVAYAMGYEEYHQLQQRLNQYQRIISHIFQSILKKVDVYQDENRLLANQLSSVWQGHVEQQMAINLLISLGFNEAERCYQMIHAFRHGPRCRRLTQTARMRLDRLMVLLLTELCEVKDTEKVLLQVMHLLENIVGRSAYLALLTENPSALKELLFWFGMSPFMTSLLVNQPFLLEVLLIQDVDWRPLSRKKCSEHLKEQLSHSADPELEEDVLREFKLKHWLLAARAELYHRIDAVRIGRFLSDVAETIVCEVCEVACRQLSEKYPEINDIKPNFAIIAYGKFGSREMNYSSDLDLVFLHAAKPEQESLVTRLTQKILHMLTTRSKAGILYSVDTRLRPSGAAGLLVSHIDAFIDYQKTKAWTWEHQALIKSRVVVGHRKIRNRFSQLKQTILSKKRDLKALKQGVLEMRAKIDKHQGEDALKYLPGGLLDLEFLLQYLVLGSGRVTFSRLTHPVSQMQHLYQEHLLSKDQFNTLKKAYAFYHQVLHQKTIVQREEDTRDMRSEVIEIANHLYQI